MANHTRHNLLLCPLVVQITSNFFWDDKAQFFVYFVFHRKFTLWDDTDYRLPIKTPPFSHCNKKISEWISLLDLIFAQETCSECQYNNHIHDVLHFNYSYVYESSVAKVGKYNENLIFMLKLYLHYTNIIMNIN